MQIVGSCLQGAPNAVGETLPGTEEKSLSNFKGKSSFRS